MTGHHMSPPAGVPTLALATGITATTQDMVATGGVMATFTEDITAPSAVTTLPTPTLASTMEAMKTMEVTAADQKLRMISAAMGRAKLKAQNIGQRN